MTNQPKASKKEESAQKARKTLLVIGNGFDLYCGFATRYSDYFNQAKEKSDNLRKWVENSSLDTFRDYVNFTIGNFNRKGCWQSINGFDNINVWDVFFYLVSPTSEASNGKRWCDIEKNMLLFLSENAYVNFPNAKKIFSVLRSETSGKDRLSDPNLLNRWEIFLAAFIFKKHREARFADDSAYYDFLLSQLNLFERDFGQFIDRQLSDENEPNQRRNPKNTLKKLCPIEDIASIDTFNYGPVNVKQVARRVRHINGDVMQPIFGVDSDKFKPTDAQYIFTKTYRRMILDSQSVKHGEQPDFESVVVFGHSLNEADYNYFIPVLDKLKIMDFTSPSKIIFAFNIYDEKNAAKIRGDIVKSVSDLFCAYSKYKGNQENPNRILDSLTTQGKVILYEVK